MRARKVRAMISEAELLDVVRDSAVARYCRTIDVLPSLSESGLIKALGKPPAVYASLRIVNGDGDMASARYALWVVAQNFRGHQAARQGDGIVLGLYDLADAVTAAVLAAGGYKFISFVPDNGEYADKYGVHTGEITFTAGTDLPNQIDLQALLAPFETFHADYDVAPTTPAAHSGWLAEPPSTTLAAPDASDTVTLPQEP